MKGCARHLFCALVLVSQALAPLALAKDYSDSAEVWNGLGYLQQTASEAKVALSIKDSIDWGEIKPSDNVFLLYPQRPLPVSEILRFVADGGDLIVADDFGSAGELFAALGVERVAPNLDQHASFFDGRRGFPTLTPERESFLFYNVKGITANHPMALTGDAKPVLSFSSTEHLIMEKGVGSGRVLLLADPSMLLNDMLRRVYGNKQFAANVLRVYCDSEPCNVTLISPQGKHTGTYRARSSPMARMTDLFNEAGVHVNLVLQELDGLLKSWPGQGVLLWVLFLACILGAGAVFAEGRIRPQQPPGEAHGAMSPQALQVVGLSGAHAEADFAGYARHLIQEVDFALLSAGKAGLSRVDKGASLHDALLRFQGERSSLHSVAPPVIGAERFLRIYHDVNAILHTLSRTRAD